MDKELLKFRQSINHNSAGQGIRMALFRRKSKNAHLQEEIYPQATGTYGGASARSQMGDLTFAEYATGVPNIRLSEMFASFGRQLKWVIPLFLIGTAGAWYLTKDFKRSYSGEGRIMVQLGEEYVYNPVTGNGGSGGLLQTPDTITLNEIGIIKSAEVMDAVIGEMSQDRATRFNKVLFAKMAAARQRGDERAYQDAYIELRKFVDQSFSVAAQPKSSLIDMSFKHEDPQIAVDTLNAFMDHYKSYRRTIFVEGSSDIISERREEAEKQLGQNERALANFLKNNRISDFESEQTGLRERTEDLKASLNTTRASIAETEASLAEVEDQLRQTPQTIDLFVDDRASQRVAQAELELKQLLAKYLPSSDPVRQKQTELAELKALQNSYNGKAAGGRRVGPNPVQQALVTRRNNLAATADSLREREFTLQRQLNSADNKIQKLTSLSPKYQNLLRERETLSLRLRNYNAKEQEALVNQSQAEASSENIREIYRAIYPVKGRNMRLVMFALATIAWGGTLFMLALLRVFLDPKLYSNPGPVTRQRSGRRSYDYDDHIPEPVTPYQPNTPLPAHEGDEYRPAAAGYTNHPAYGGIAAAGSAPAYAPTEWIPEQASEAASAHYQTDAITGHYETNPVAGQPYYTADGSAALDAYHNPYTAPQQNAHEQPEDVPPVFGPPPTN